MRADLRLSPTIVSMLTFSPTQPQTKHNLKKVGNKFLMRGHKRGIAAVPLSSGVLFSGTHAHTHTHFRTCARSCIGDMSKENITLSSRADLRIDGMFTFHPVSRHTHAHAHVHVYVPTHSCFGDV